MPSLSSIDMNICNGFMAYLRQCPNGASIERVKHYMKTYHGLTADKTNVLLDWMYWNVSDFDRGPKRVWCISKRKAKGTLEAATQLSLPF